SLQPRHLRREPLRLLRAPSRRLGDAGRCQPVQHQLRILDAFVLSRHGRSLQSGDGAVRLLRRLARVRLRSPPLVLVVIPSKGERQMNRKCYGAGLLLAAVVVLAAAPLHTASAAGRDGAEPPGAAAQHAIEIASPSALILFEIPAELQDGALSVYNACVF